MSQNYVIGVVLDASLSRAICLRKQKGPPALIGKWSFPGGKVDPHEEPTQHSPGEGTPFEYHQAMSRELKEETGVAIPPADWISFGRKSFDNGDTLHLFAVIGTEEDFANARTLETEEVKVLDVGEGKDLSLAYAPDFDYLIRITTQYFKVY